LSLCDFGLYLIDMENKIITYWTLTKHDSITEQVLYWSTKLKRFSDMGHATIYLTRAGAKRSFQRHACKLEGVKYSIEERKYQRPRGIR